jgi:anti-sigma factor RsiW
MKPESLHALIIDRHFGELSPEAAELLEHHLAAHPAARAEAERILQSLEIAHNAVLRHPELARVPVEMHVVPRVVNMPSKMPWLARAAALALLAGAGGFFAGRSNVSTTAAIAESAPEPRRESPWAKYRMSFDPAGEGMQVVRVDTEKLETKSLP